MRPVLPLRFELVQTLRDTPASSTFVATDHVLGRNKVVVKELTVQGVFTQTGPHYDQAIALLARDSAKFTRLHTHSFPLDRAADAIETLAGERAGEDAICVSLSP